MALEWIWYFIWYSFLGFLLEVGYARWTGGRRDRKCLLLLPLCPVYGLGACAVLLLPPWVLERPLLLVVAGGPEWSMGWLCSMSGCFGSPSGIMTG